ncbi:MAG: response regulator transcription factor [Verrucomicrobiota bacterium]
MKPTRILLADDHQLLRQGLKRLLLDYSDLDVCASVDSGTEALAAIREHEPDVSVLDHSMTGLTGVEVLQQLRADKRRDRVIILSSFGKPILVAEALRHGASGFVIKEDAFDDLAAAIRSVAGGTPYVSKSIDETAVIEAFHSLAFTPRELQVLGEMLEGKSSREIGEDFEISARTVETYRNQLIAKFGAKNSLDLIRRALDAGFVPAAP